MADATEAAVVDANAEALDKAIRREMWRVVRAAVPLRSHLRVRCRLHLTVDVAAGPDEGDICMERLIGPPRVG
jgi:hypothetical protein